MISIIIAIIFFFIFLNKAKSSGKSGFGMGLFGGISYYLPAYIATTISAKIVVESRGDLGMLIPLLGVSIVFGIIVASIVYKMSFANSTTKDDSASTEA